MTLTLSACGHFGGKLHYPELPPDIVTCFDYEVPQPKKGRMSKAKVLRLVAALKQSEATKRACGLRFIRFYEALGTNLP